MARRERLIGRVLERRVLEETLASRRSEFVAVYGRRRVGKTFLVRRVVGVVPRYFEVVGIQAATMREQLTVFNEALGRAFRNIDERPPASWHEAFGRLRSAIERDRRRGRCVLFLDELPWLATRRSGLLSALEHFWNAFCSAREDIVLVVCGSAASWITRKIVRAKGGLHNRLTRTIRLVPFTVEEVHRYLESRQIHMTQSQVLELYSVLGGVPHYLSLVERGRSVPQIVDELCFRSSAALATEYNNLYEALFENAAGYMTIVRALSKSRRGLTRYELLDATGLPTGGSLRRMVDALEEGGFVGTTIPFGKTERGRVYRLVDEFSLFHLRWMDRMPSAGYARAAAGYWITKSATPSYRAWAGLSFETVCLKHVDAIKRELGIGAVHSTESTWYARPSDASEHGAQIGLLIDRADGVITACEMKFSVKPFAIDKRYAEQLTRKLDAFRQTTGTKKAVQLIFVTKHGLRENRYSDSLVDRVVTADALFRA